MRFAYPVYHIDSGVEPVGLCVVQRFFCNWGLMIFSIIQSKKAQVY